MTVTFSPRAGWIDDMERRDDDLGPERDETDNQLGRLLLRTVRAHDARVPAGRRAVRTVQEYRARMIRASGQPSCPACAGLGGRTADTSSAGVRRTSWQTCQSCAGTGVAR